jgi:CRP-like cAMP-binding protein
MRSRDDRFRPTRRSRCASFGADARVTLGDVAGAAKPHAAGKLLSMLEPDDRAALVALGRRRLFRRGARLIVQGDHSDDVFVLLEGRVKVTRDTLEGLEIVLSVLGPGDLLGEFEAIEHDGSPRSAGNVALEDVECRVLSAGEFLEFLDRRPRAAVMVARAILQRLRAADRRRTEVGSLDTAHRLARFLVELVEQHGRPTSAGTDIDIPLTQEELASLIAASRESVVRALTSLRSRGLVATGRRRITVCDLDGLRRFAG